MDFPFFRPILVAAIIGLGTAQAQTVPDAGVLRQQIENERPLPLPAPLAPLKDHEPGAKKDSSGPVVKVWEFRFSGNTLLSAAQLEDAVRDYVGRELRFDELQRAAEAVAARYREAGWVVHCFLPRQDVTDGVVTIQVIEARFGGAVLDGEAPQRLDEAHWRAIIAAAQPKGAYLSAKALDRALLLLDDMPGVAASGSLVGGKEAGQTDLLVKLVDEPLFTGSLGYDNAGSRSTGENRYTGNLSVNSPFRFGDRLSANLIHTEGNDYGRLAYSVPVGSQGLRVGANVSNLEYRLVSPQFAALDVRGTSISWGVDASYPMRRSRQENVYLSASLDRKRFDNQASGTTTSKYNADVLGLGLIGNSYDSLGGGGSTEGSLFLTGGRIDSEGAVRTDRSDGDFSKVRWNLSRQQTLIGYLSGYIAWNGQWSNKNLDSSEKFYLGGPQGVRAYPVNEGGGTTGDLINLELRQPVASNWVLTGFFDYGRVRQYIDNSDTAGRSLTGSVSNTLIYRGYGLSVGWAGPFGSQIKATWARRIGENPNPAFSGTDQDGSLDRDRLWFAVSIPFEYSPKTGRGPFVTQRSDTAIPVAADLRQGSTFAGNAVADIANQMELDGDQKALRLSRRSDVGVSTGHRLSAVASPANPTDAAAIANALEQWRSHRLSGEAARLQGAEADAARPAAPVGPSAATQRRRPSKPVQVSLELSEQRIRIDGETATVSFTERYSSPEGNATKDRLLTLKREGKAWRVVG